MEATPSSKTGEPARVDLVGAQTIRPGWVLLSILIVLVSGIVAILQAPDPQPTKPQKSFLEWLRYPVERNPGLRLPSAPAQINSVAFADNSRTGLAVGQGGTILASTDGGETWTAQNSGVSNTLTGIYCDATCGQAWAVGSRGVILNTRDGGEHWNARQIQSNSDIDLFAVQFRNGGTSGWVVGSLGSIWATLDGGQTWQKQVNPDPGSRLLSALYFDAQGQRGWAVGALGAILTTNDGGATWSTQDRGGNSLASVSFTPDGQHGWAVGYNTILSTTDGGDHWLSANRPDPTSQVPLYFTSIEFNADGRRGWVTREDGTIFSTVDGGNTWAKQNSGINTNLVTHFDEEGLHGWAVGSSGTILSTNDGGLDWITRTSSKVSHLFSIHVDAAGKFAAAVGDAGIIIATLDGGAHWTSQTSGVAQRLNGVDFLDDNQRGWAVGNTGTIIATNDGGEHWIAQESPTAVSLYAVQFNSTGQQGWAVGGSGAILNTENGGQKWNARFLSGAPLLNSIYFEPQGIRGWIVGGGGSIFASTDGGQTWKPQNSPTNKGLWGLWFDSKGQRGWAVGNAGTIISTSNGGQTWTIQQSGDTADLGAVQFLAGGQQGWIAGDNGVILTTTNGGANWSAADSKVGSTRESLAFAGNGSVGWAVGYPPALVKTSDGGKTWEPIPWPLINQRYPAPWFWLTLLVVAFCFWRSVRIDPASVTRGIEAIGTSDAPIGEFALDRLQFGSLARGISRFLRNTNTRPPLTLTISGDWGSGKSTLMELVSTDLRHYGIKAVWFNAWHHQQEEQLLAALLNAIRDKGLPQVGSADGLAFRFRLLLMRSKKHFVISLAIIATIAVLTGYLLGHNFSEWTNLWNALSDIGASMSRTQESIKTNITLGDVSWLSAQIIGGTAALYSLYRGLTAFKIDPAVLLSTTAENFKLKDASAQTSFRSRFATEFEEVTRALPYTMVIIIDDLDRCQPATVLTVMEAVNFLISSGECFVIFGMATNRVEAALALEFENIADELAAFENKLPTVTKENLEREHRLSYVRDYLDKLINLEVVVPNRSDILPHLLDDLPTLKSPVILTAIRQCLEFWPSWLAGVVLMLGLLFGFEYDFPHVNIQKAPPVAQVSQVSAAKSVTATPAAPVVLSPISQVTANRYIPAMQKNNEFVLDKLAIAITLALIAAIAGGITLYGLRAALRRVYDSQTFREALQIWMPVVQCRRVTPRGIKRFSNRLRYLAMLQQRANLDETGFDKLRRRLTTFPRPFRKRDALAAQEHVSQIDASVEPGITESLLVALASLYEVYGPEWQSYLQPTSSGNLEVAIQKATKSYEQTTRTNWPPSSADLAIFEQLLKGIRLA